MVEWFTIDILVIWMGVGGEDGPVPHLSANTKTPKILHTKNYISIKFFQAHCVNQYISQVNYKSVVPHHPPPCPPVTFLFRNIWMLAA